MTGRGMQTALNWRKYTDTTTTLICGSMYKKAVAVSDIMEVIGREKRDMDKVQGLFADMREREQAWQELAKDKRIELVGSLKYNIEINAAGVNKGKGLIKLGELLGIRNHGLRRWGQ